MELPNRRAAEVTAALTKEDVLATARKLFAHYGWSHPDDIAMRSNIERMRDLALSALASRPGAPVASQAEIDAGHLWHALKDLSFDCDGVTWTVAPQLGTYNATFAVCNRLAQKYQAAPHYQERTPNQPASPTSPPAQEGKEPTALPDQRFAPEGCEFYADPQTGELVVREKAPTPPSEKERERLGDELLISETGLAIETACRTLAFPSPTIAAALRRMIASLRQADAPVGWKERRQALVEAMEAAAKGAEPDWNAFPASQREGIDKQTAYSLGHGTGLLAAVQAIKALLAVTPRPAGSAE